MLKIYGNRKSNNCNKVEYVLKILGIPYNYKEMDFQKDIKTPEYLKIHPAGKIPAIDEDGFIVFESTAICKYLCSKYNHSLYPHDLKKRALIDQWIDFCTIHLGVAMSRVAFNRTFAPLMNIPVDEAIINDGLKILERFLPIIDDKLKDADFITVNELSLADVNLISILSYLEPAKVDISKYKNLKNYWDKMQEKEFYQTVHK